jgi:NAD(P)-dependent dehydrogenase (short-subunit alcohol dehydrogenase family)
MTPVRIGSGPALADSVVLITGAGSGIGRATAVAFARAGSRVVLGGRRRDRLEETAGLCPDRSTIRIHVCDVTLEEDVARLTAVAVEDFGRLDIAFNNAGSFGRFGPLHEDDEANFDAVLDVNLRGVWRCMRHQLAHMVPRGSGSIVNCSSVAGHRGHQRSPLYAASKHAVIGLSKSAALQYASHGIRVNVVSPGSTDTEMLTSLYADGSELAARRERAPMRRLGEAHEVAQAVLWLGGPDSSYVTGQTVVVDGGVTARAG